MWNFFRGRVVVAANRKDKGDKRWLRPRIIIVGFVNKYALIHRLVSYLEVGLRDMRSVNRTLDVIGCDGSL